MNCSNCKKPIKDGAKFCPHCGAPQSAAQPAPQRQPQPPIQPAPQYQPQPKKKSGAPILIASFLAVLIIAAAAAFLVMGGYLDSFMGNKDSSSQTSVVRTKDDSKDDDSDTEDEETSETTLSAEEEREREELSATFDTLSARDISNAFGSERDMIGTYKINIENYLKDGRFGEARVELIRWQNLLDAINGSNNYTMDVEQVDVSEYPKVKVYLRIEDKTTLEAVDFLKQEGFIIHERVDGTADFVRRDVLRASQLDNVASLNISMVADVSGSMSGTPLSDAKNVMTDFLNNVQPQVGDKVSLITFANQVDIQTAFTGDTSAAYQAIYGMSANGGTALYDALYVAVNQTAAQDGAKCVIGFTDGADNNSRCTPQIVAELAKRYSIPIYLIGVGSGYNTSDLEYIASNTGGFYRSVGQISSMAEIYQAIFREQKEMYLVEYETLQQDNKNVSRNLNLDYVDETMAVRKEYTYVPQIYMEVVVSGAQMFINDFIIYDSDSRYVTSADLDRLTQEQLRLARNEIYARRGRLFNDQYLQGYFNSKSWYHGTIAPSSFNEGYFNDYERANAYFIADYERLKGYIK